MLDSKLTRMAMVINHLHLDLILETSFPVAKTSYAFENLLFAVQAKYIFSAYFMHRTTL